MGLEIINKDIVKVNFTGHFVMVPLNMTCMYCLQHYYIERGVLYNLLLYYVKIPLECSNYFWNVFKILNYLTSQNNPKTSRVYTWDIKLYIYCVT